MALPCVASAEQGRPGGRLPARIPLPNGLQPEGITSGPGATFYVGSFGDGRIAKGNLRTGTVRTLLSPATGRSLRGLFFDRRTGLVWAVGSLGTEGHVWAVDAVSGAVAGDTVVPGAGFLNDLVVTPRAVGVTDSSVDRLTVVRLTRSGHPTGSPARFVGLTGAWPASPPNTFNANGIRALTDDVFVLNNTRVGGLWQVDGESGATRRIAVTGGPPITSGDGLELLDHAARHRLTRAGALRHQRLGRTGPRPRVEPGRARAHIGRDEVDESRIGLSRKHLRGDPS